MRTNATDRGLRKCGSPQLYGGTERVVSHLTEELVRQGHKVTLFASGDSQTDAILRAPCDRALRLSSECKDPLIYHYISLNRTEELVRQGHKVTLFASGDSQTDAILRAPCDRALRLSSECKDPLVYHYISLNRVP